MTDTAALVRAAADRVQDPQRRFIAAPALVEPIARLLRSAAADAMQGEPHPYDVALARAILGDAVTPETAETGPDGGQERPGGREATPGRVETHAGAQNRACGRGHRRWPLHCTEPAGHTGDHASPWGNGGAAWGEGDAQPPPVASLRDRIAEALANWSLRDGNGRGLTRLNATVRANAESRADAVLAVVGPELDRLEHRAHRAEATSDADTKQLAEVDVRADKAEATLRLMLERLDRLEAHWHDQPHTETAAQVRAALADIRSYLDGGEQP
jgi:uncharacterized coiled-coil protein SlyX